VDPGALGGRRFTAYVLSQDHVSMAGTAQDPGAASPLGFVARKPAVVLGTPGAAGQSPPARLLGQWSVSRDGRPGTLFIDSIDGAGRMAGRFQDATTHLQVAGQLRSDGSLFFAMQLNLLVSEVFTGYTHGQAPGLMSGTTQIEDSVSGFYATREP
jgi:hypothetical protein